MDITNPIPKTDAYSGIFGHWFTDEFLSENVHAGFFPDKVFGPTYATVDFFRDVLTIYNTKKPSSHIEAVIQELKLGGEVQNMIREQVELPVPTKQLSQFNWDPVKGYFTDFSSLSDANKQRLQIELDLFLYKEEEKKIISPKLNTFWKDKIVESDDSMRAFHFQGGYWNAKEEQGHAIGYYCNNDGILFTNSGEGLNYHEKMTLKTTATNRTLASDAEYSNTAVWQPWPSKSLNSKPSLSEKADLVISLWKAVIRNQRIKKPEQTINLAYSEQVPSFFRGDSELI